MVMRSPVRMFHMQIVPLLSPLMTCSKAGAQAHQITLLNLSMTMVMRSPGQMFVQTVARGLSQELQGSGCN